MCRGGAGAKNPGKRGQHPPSCGSGALLQQREGLELREPPKKPERVRGPLQELWAEVDGHSPGWNHSWGSEGGSVICPVDLPATPTGRTQQAGGGQGCSVMLPVEGSASQMGDEWVGGWCANGD